MEWLTNALGAVLGGGATGLLGSLLSRWADYRTEKLRLERADKQHQNDLEMTRLEAELNVSQIRAESDGRLAVAQENRKAAVAQADSEALIASIEADRATYSGGGNHILMLIVDFVRGMLRPSLTLYYTVFATVITYQVYGMASRLKVLEAMPAEKVFGMYEEVILLVLYLASTITLWWFGSRGKAPKR